MVVVTLPPETTTGLLYIRPSETFWPTVAEARGSSVREVIVNTGVTPQSVTEALVNEVKARARPRPRAKRYMWTFSQKGKAPINFCDI